MQQALLYLHKYKTEEEMEQALEGIMNENLVPDDNDETGKPSVTYVPLADGVTTAKEFFNKRIQEEKVKDMKKGSILAVELEVRHTDKIPEVFEEEALARETLSFVMEEFGRANIMYFTQHFAGCPHIHAIIVPIMRSKLCYSAFIDGEVGKYRFEKKFYNKHLRKLGFQPGLDLELPAEVLYNKVRRRKYIYQDSTSVLPDVSCHIANVKCVPTAKAYIGSEVRFREEKIAKARIQQTLNRALLLLQLETEEKLLLEKEVQLLRQQKEQL